MFEELLNTNASIQKLTKAELKLKSKPWLTKGMVKLMTSIKKKNVIYKKIIEAKNPAEKTFHKMISNTIEIISLN